MLKKRALNDRLMLAERGFLDADGLQGRQWFKHLVSAFLFLDSLKLIVTDNCVDQKIGLYFGCTVNDFFEILKIRQSLMAGKTREMKCSLCNG